MTRLPIMLLVALVGSSTHQIGLVTPPHSTRLSDAPFPAEALTEVRNSPACPVANCLIDPVSLTRGVMASARAVGGVRAPARAISEFLATEGQEAELVVVTSDRKRTTVRAWLNEEAVLLPSAMPRSGTDEVRVPVTLIEENVLEFRLSGRKETEVVFWIESGDATPPPPGNEGPTLEFRLSNEAVDPNATMNAVCSADHGDGFEIAEWADVVAGMDPSPIHEASTAWIQWDGLGSFSPFPFSPTYHYLVSAVGNVSPTYYYGTTGVEPNRFWLNGAFGMRRILCKGPASP